MSKINLFIICSIFFLNSGYSQKDITDVINSSNDEYGLTFITENLACFTRDEGRKKLMLIKRVNGKWQTPEIAPFSGTWRDEYPTFDKSANRLYFASKRPITSNGNMQSKNDIWYVEYNNGVFGTPKHMGKAFSTEGIDSGGFGVGETLYFHSDRSGLGMNAVDIYQGNLKNGKVEKLPFNSSRVDGEPFVFNNGKSIIFMSAGHGSLGKSDIFITRLKNGTWTKPLLVDDKGLVNTTAWEYAPALSLDGKTLYYTRIQNGKSDILSIKVNHLSNSGLFHSLINEHDLVYKASMNYLEGFYEGNETKLKQSISTNLYKYGYWKSDGKYTGEQMTYAQALKFANDVKENKKFAKKTAIKKVEVLDVLSHIASAKITAWWGIDYALLSKKDGKWIIEQILWQGPLKDINHN